MYKCELAYCYNCDNFVKFTNKEETVREEIKGVPIEYTFRVSRCKKCGEEISSDSSYNKRKADASNKAFLRAKGIISTDEIEEIINKYDVGKESLASIAKFGKNTIKRYFEGFYPSKEYSEKLYSLAKDEEFFISCVEEIKTDLKEITYQRIRNRYRELMQLNKSKIEQVANYIVVRVGDVTPLALQKLLYFSEGVNYALNNKQLITDKLEAWQHGPVYPIIYRKYKHFGYKPIDDGIACFQGCTVSLLSEDELKAIDLVIETFGLYSPKVLEKITHDQNPWKEKRIGYREDEAGNESIEEKAIKAYFIRYKLNKKTNIMKYIMDALI